MRSDSVNAGYKVSGTPWPLSRGEAVRQEVHVCVAGPSEPYFPMINSFWMLTGRGLVLPVSQFETLFTDTPSFLAKSFCERPAASRMLRISSGGRAI